MYKYGCSLKCFFCNRHETAIFKASSSKKSVDFVNVNDFSGQPSKESLHFVNVNDFFGQPSKESLHFGDFNLGRSRVCREMTK